jgi:hypothetical protein
MVMVVRKLIGVALVLPWAALGATVFTHEVRSTVKKQPEIVFLVRLPEGVRDGRDVQGVLAYCTWETDPNQLILKLDDKNVQGDPVKRFAASHNLAILQWNCRTLWDSGKSHDELSTKQAHTSDANFDKVAVAWERGVRELQQQMRLPMTNMLLYGISRGAQWAHRLALRKPEYFRAVHVHVNSSYDEPTPAARRCLWLITTGEVEHGYRAAQRFYTDCRALGYPMIFKAGAGLGHSGDLRITKLGLAFFDYALNPAARELPVAEGALYVGDWLNQAVYPQALAAHVPVAQRVWLPTRELATAWGELREK